MKIAASLIVVVLTSSSIDDKRSDDALVISGCIQSEVGNISTDPPIPHPAGVAYVSVAGPQSDGFVSDSQVLAELEDWEGRSTERFPEKIRERLGNWSVPQINLDGFDVQYFAPLQEGRSLSFALWPPAYSDKRTSAFVRMMFTPSAHGATLTCTLKRVRNEWLVEKRWVKYFV